MCVVGQAELTLCHCLQLPQSEADDTKPHYTVSSGDYIYKMHDEGVIAQAC